MIEKLNAIAAALTRLAESGDVRQTGELALADIRIDVARALDAAQAAQDAAPVVDPIDVQLKDIKSHLNGMSETMKKWG